MIPRTALVLVLAAAGVAACGGSADEAASANAPRTAPPSSDAAATTEMPTTTAGAPMSSSTSTAPSASTTTITDPSATPSISCVEYLDLRSAAALVVWPAAEPSQWSQAVEAVGVHGVGGVILMRTGDWDVDELSRRLRELESSSRHGLVVSTDEEGGVVQRLRLLGDLPSQRELGRLAPDDLRSTVADHGRAVRSVGVDVVFGPVVDVAPVDGEVPLDASRFFSGGPDEVASAAEAVIDGWHDADVVATLKHYPGHGAASGDTHDVDGLTPPIDALEERDLVPYRRLADRAVDGDLLVMVGHLTVPGLTDGLPATRSAAAVAYLRSIAGYGEALLVTDALGMGAVGLPEPDAAVAALVAGIDVALFTRTSQTGPVIDAIVAAVDDGRLDERQLRRSAEKVMTLLERDGHTCGAPAS